VKKWPRFKNEVKMGFKMPEEVFCIVIERVPFGVGLYRNGKN
jgi:hypothetical protein